MKSSFLALLVSIVTSAAQAGIYLEPYIGYDSSTSKGEITITAPAQAVYDADAEEAGAQFGAKIGYATGSWIFGVDFLTGELVDKEDNEATHMNTGVFATHRFNNVFSATLGYIAASSIKRDDLEVTGSGFRVGLSTQVHARMKINLDYLMTNYDKLDNEGSEGKSDIDTSSIVLSLGFPVQF
jgi:hypothetical protein